MIIKENTYEKVRTEINKSTDKNIIFSSNDDELNRNILEKLKINILLLNLSNRKDKLKQRNSGLNQVLAKIAQKNRISIGINLDEIIEEKNLIEKSKIISRLKQNIKLCNKNKLKIKFISQKKENERNLHDLKSLGLVLGMPNWITKEL